MGFSKQEYWRGSPFHPPADLPKPGDRIRISCIGRQVLYPWATRGVLWIINCLCFSLHQHSCWMSESILVWQIQVGASQEGVCSALSSELPFGGQTLSGQRKQLCQPRTCPISVFPCLKHCMLGPHFAEKELVGSLQGLNILRSSSSSEKFPSSSCHVQKALHPTPCPTPI